VVSGRPKPTWLAGWLAGDVRRVEAVGFQKLAGRLDANLHDVSRWGGAYLFGAQATEMAP
jgi:hypothetical protein